MRLVGFVVVAWVLYQVYPHIRIEFAPDVKPIPTYIDAPVIPIPPPLIKAPVSRKPCIGKDGLMEYGAVIKRYP